MRIRITFSILTLALMACDRPQAAAPVATTIPAPTGVVDSALPREELLRRFRVDLPEVHAFTHGATSREALGRMLAGALERRDTAALREITVTRAEFGWLYYPTSAQGLPPYDLGPGLYWFMLEERSSKGLRWLFQNRSGAPLHYVGIDCGKTSTKEGENTTWGPCLIRRVQAPGDTIVERYLSQVVERGGQYKVLAYDGGRD